MKLRTFAAFVLTAAGCRAGGSSGSGSGSAVPELSEPTVLASDDGGPAAITVDDGFAYWCDFGKPIVRKLPRGGGAPVTLYQGTGELGGMSLALAGDSLYFVEGFTIERVARVGGAVAHVGDLDSLPARVTAAGDVAYAATVGAIRGYPDRRPPATLATGAEIWDLAVDATHVYWVDDVGVARVPRTGGAVERLAKASPRFARLALSEVDAYWGDAQLDAVFAVPKAGGPVRFVAGGWTLDARQLVFDRGMLWTIQGGALLRIDPATGDVSTTAVALGRNGSADHYLAFAVAGGDVFVASGGATLRGVGPVVIDLTKPNPKLPEYTYSGEILRLPSALPARPIVEHRGELQIAAVWFRAATRDYQDPANAVRWIEALADAVVPSVRRGALGLRVTGVTAAAVDAKLARDRAELVAQAIRGKLGGTPRIEIAVEPEHTGSGDVRVALAANELTAAMTMAKP